jgi:ribonuclease P protein component
VLERGKRAGVGGLTTAALANARPQEPARLGLAVRSKRGAVARNRVKRRLRAAFRQLGTVDGYDVVVRADDGILSKEYGVLVEDLRVALGRATRSRP